MVIPTRSNLLMEDKGITVYRTDLDGTIVAISDGKEVYFKD